MAKIIWTEAALEDLASIFEFIAKDSSIFATRQINKIVTRIEQLETFPQSGRVVPEFEIETIRELIEGNYRLVYKIESGDLIAIIRIHHSARILNLQ